MNFTDLMNTIIYRWIRRNEKKPKSKMEVVARLHISKQSYLVLGKETDLSQTEKRVIDSNCHAGWLVLRPLARQIGG